MAQAGCKHGHARTPHPPVHGNRNRQCVSQPGGLHFQNQAIERANTLYFLAAVRLLPPVGTSILRRRRDDSSIPSWHLYPTNLPVFSTPLKYSSAGHSTTIARDPTRKTNGTRGPQVETRTTYPPPLPPPVSAFKAKPQTHVKIVPTNKRHPPNGLLSFYARVHIFITKVFGSFWPRSSRLAYLSAGVRVVIEPLCTVNQYRRMYNYARANTTAGMTRVTT